MNIAQYIADELNIALWQVESTIALIDDGNTIPFIARYRKEVTGSLDDEQLREFHEKLIYQRNLLSRKEAVINAIKEQDKLTEELNLKINDAKTLVEVEDIYRPYKLKKRTRATIAKEKGLEPLALIIYLQKAEVNIKEEAAAFIDIEKGVASIEEAIEGAKDILAEQISDDADLRKIIRNKTIDKGMLVSKGKTDETTVYEMYYDYQESVNTVANHRILAINRGESEKILTVKIDAPVEEISDYMIHQNIRETNNACTDILKSVIDDAYKRLIAPSIEREIRSELSEFAETGAISVFGKNLTQLLMQPPIAGKVVLGLDPAFRTGCKIAVVDATGKVLDTTVVYPTPPLNKIEEAEKKLIALIKKHNVSLISIGNGTASRESEQFVADMLKKIEDKVQYIIANESGASVYSASKLGTEEFPDFDVALRSAASIARRIQDPLAELVKIDPKAIGVGQYQHDMNQKKLDDALTGVVEDCVNKVGVDLNTASSSLLKYISGISKAIADNIVKYRDQNGRFSTRKDLLKVAKLGPKAYEQCAGFLRIPNGKNVLDNTSVHPESYEVTEKLLSKLGIKVKDINNDQTKIKLSVSEVKQFAIELGIGEPTLIDIIKELEKPGRDPRAEMPLPLLRADVLNMKDLQEGMILKGTIRNVIDFGAFVDIGVHQDGLVHISEITNRYIKHPLEVISVGDVVDVRVLGIDLKRNRISLSMKI